MGRTGIPTPGKEFVFKAAGVRPDGKELAFKTALALVCTVIFLLIVYPLYFIVIASFSDSTLVSTGKVLFWPKNVSLFGYQEIFKDARIWTGYRNTVFYTLFGTLVNLVFTLPAAYVLSRREFRARRVIMFLFVVTMFFNGGLIPTYLLMKDLHLTNTIWVFILPFCVNVFYLIIARTFFETSLPQELHEAAVMDGCSHFTFFVKVALPLSKHRAAFRIILSNNLPSYNFYLVNLIDRQYTARQIINVKSVALTCMVIIVFAMLAVFVMSRRLTGSLTRLVRQMSTIAKKDFSNYITVSGGFEVRELGKAFNYMLDELNDYIRRLLETQKEQRNAELAALQRQINPHFLYNTLASIKMLVQKGSKSAAAETINALISLLQNTISNVSETITIGQELENMKNYVFINHVRYGDRIKVNYFVSPDCLLYEVPKLIIQPFIENAFFHAFNEKNEGTIYILISKNDGSLVCEVVDNGDGMELTEGADALPNPKSNRQLFTGIGIQNVDNRIKLLYGEPYGVHISSAKGEGTKIRIVLPLVAGAEENKAAQINYQNPKI